MSSSPTIFSSLSDVTITTTTLVAETVMAAVTPTVEAVASGSIEIFSNTDPSQAATSSSRWSSGMKSLLANSYYIFWVYPIYIVSFILNTAWYQQIADRAYHIVYGKRVAHPQTYDWFLKRISDEIYRGLLLFNYILLATIIYHAVPTLTLTVALPNVLGVFSSLFGDGSDDKFGGGGGAEEDGFYRNVRISFPLGYFTSFMMVNWISAFLCFEYKWVGRGWTLDRRVEYFEERWAYFAGFGLPITMCTFFFPQFVSAGLFALLFPMYIIMANRSSPVPRTYVPIPVPASGPSTSSSSSKTSTAATRTPTIPAIAEPVRLSTPFPKRIRIFAVPSWMNNFIIVGLCGRRKRGGGTSAVGRDEGSSQGGNSSSTE
ncbi:Etoposide induced 2.4 mRNA [Blyttiomyces sp. JEL0837]|nr:Etoposide induced 2.4 mRNA [Blyttiomyces sp. JEL0837]